ncbi:hypothetical protein D3C72_2230350 [compost metagenome]
MTGKDAAEHRVPEFHRITKEQVVMLDTQGETENLEHDALGVNFRADLANPYGVL